MAHSMRIFRLGSGESRFTAVTAAQTIQIPQTAIGNIRDMYTAGGCRISATRGGQYIFSRRSIVHSI